LSIEVGHFYMEDLLNGEDRIREQFKRVAPWVATATASARAELGPKARVSTCFLTDDYFHRNTDPNVTGPAPIMKKLIRIAEEAGIQIDYMAREAGCHVADGVPLAELTAALLLAEPPMGTNGSRPPPHESGWLCNGDRSTDVEPDMAMRVQPWRPPIQFGKRNHSIFLDVELWKDITVEEVDGEQVSRRSWSCPFLASVWHLLRLGMLRYKGDPVAQPQLWEEGDDWPEQWSDLPAVIQLNPRAAPFSAFRTMSILPRYYLAIENAVEVILGHLDLDEAVVNQVVERGRKEGITVSTEINRRVSHIFIEDVEPPGGSFKTTPLGSDTARGQIGGTGAGLVLNKPPDIRGNVNADRG
jgi:hypothetical protein